MTQMASEKTTIPASDLEMLAQLKKSSFLVILLGLTGVGKSNLLERLGARPLRMSTATAVGHQLESHTRDVDFHQLDYRNESFIFIDTPGFEDGVRQNSDVLQMIAAFLATSYHEKRHPDAVIYAFKTTETRFMGHAKKNRELFEELCGTNDMRLVTLLTTMWDIAGNVPPNTAADFETREESLIQDY